MIITLKQNAAQTEVSRLRSELEAQYFRSYRRHCIPRCSPN